MRGRVASPAHASMFAAGMSYTLLCFYAVILPSILALQYHYSLSLTHTYTHPFNGSLSRTTQVNQYQKVKPVWILLKQETVSGTGISWAICKSAPRSRQITMPAPTSQFFTGWMPFLPPNQQHQSTEGSTTTVFQWNVYSID